MDIGITVCHSITSTTLERRLLIKCKGGSDRVSIGEEPRYKDRLEAELLRCKAGDQDTANPLVSTRYNLRHTGIMI